MADPAPESSPLARVVRDLPVGALALDASGRLLVANPRAARLLGLPDRVEGHELLVDPRVVAARLDTPLRAALEGAPVSLAGIPYEPEPGRTVALDLEIGPVAPGVPGPARVLAVVQPSSDPGAEVARAELFYQSFLHSHDAIEVTDRHGILVDVNPAFERIYGYRRNEVIGGRPRVVRSPRTPPEVYRRLWADILDPAKGRWSGEIINIDRQGREHPVSLSIDAIRDSAGEITHFIGVATDLTEQKSFERQVARADRLASIGQLAAGVAHELNTPLANIMLIAESLHRRAPNPWVQGRANSITQQVDAASKIVRGLLDFARNYPPRVDEVDLVAVAQEAVAFARGKQSMDIRIVERYDVAPLRIRGDRLELIQVLVNLINNAYDAMDGQGTLTLATASADGLAELSVADTGSGIPPSVLPRIFEPFFTTKTEGKGTGLGLSICHGIVRAHGGVIDVATELGRGTRFTIRLPLAETSPSTGTDPAAASARASAEPP